MKRNSKEVDIITLFYNLEKTTFVFVNNSNKRISSTELFELYDINEKDSMEKEIMKALVKFHRNEILNNLLS